MTIPMGWGLFFLAWSCSPVSAQGRPARFEIDAKRKGVGPTDKDALPRGREFISLGSTYYVGWMYTGMYKNERAADYAGYRQSLPDLLRAFKLLEKDYSGILVSLFDSPQLFMQNNGRLGDYILLAGKLRDTYESIDVPDSAMWVLTGWKEKN